MKTSLISAAALFAVSVAPAFAQDASVDEIDCNLAENAASAACGFTEIPSFDPLSLAGVGAGLGGVGTGAIVLGAAGVLAVVAGGGGDDDPTTPTTPSTN